MMKTCLVHRENLVLLAAGRLDERAAETLRAHVRQCPPCQERLTQLSGLCSGLEHAARMLPPVANEDAFHLALVARIRPSCLSTASPALPPNVWKLLFAPAWKRVSWAAALALSVFLLHRPMPPAVSDTRPSTPRVAHALPTALPSLGAYQRAAGESWESFQTLLAADADRRSPADQNVTALTRDAGGVAD